MLTLRKTNQPITNTKLINFFSPDRTHLNWKPWRKNSNRTWQSQTRESSKVFSMACTNGTNGPSAWSTIQTIMTANPSGISNLVSPANNAVTSNVTPLLLEQLQCASRDNILEIWIADFDRCWLHLASQYRYICPSNQLELHAGHGLKLKRTILLAGTFLQYAWAIQQLVCGANLHYTLDNLRDYINEESRWIQ